MAPIRKRSSIRSRASHATPRRSLPVHQAAAVEPGGGLTKKDKRTLKHAALMERVRDASVQKTTKRRRPGKKLFAAEDVGGMRDALPDVEGASGEDEDEWEGLSDGDDDAAGTTKRRRRKKAAGSGKMVMRSLQHRPGAMKRKRQMEGREMDRFSRNMAQMLAPGRAAATAGNDGQKQSSSTQQREKWVALRRFISQTMEPNAAFATGRG